MNEMRAAAAMFVVGTLAAVSAVISQYPFYGGQAMRYAMATLIYLAVARLSGVRHLRLSRREVLLLLALSGTGLVLFNLFVVTGAAHASPAMVGTIVGAVPVVLAVLAPLLARKRPSATVVIGASIVVAGAAITTGLGSSDALGVVSSLGALACEVCFSMLALPLLPRLGPLLVSTYASAMAVPMLLAVGLAQAGPVFRMPTLAEGLSLAYLGTLVSVGGFLLWYSALPKLGADRAGLFAGVLPIGAIVTTAVLGLGMPTPVELAGAALVIAGILLGTRKITPKARRWPRRTPRSAYPHPPELSPGT